MSSQMLERKQFVCWWDIEGGRAAVAGEEAFTIEQGYSADDIAEVHSMEVDEILDLTQMTMHHKIWRVK